MTPGHWFVDFWFRCSLQKPGAFPHRQSPPTFFLSLYFLQRFVIKSSCPSLSLSFSVAPLLALRPLVHSHFRELVNRGSCRVLTDFVHFLPEAAPFRIFLLTLLSLIKLDWRKIHKQFGTVDINPLCFFSLHWRTSGWNSGHL